MESIYILIPISILLAFVIGIFFWWSSKSGQFDDLDGPGYRVLMDDDATDHLLSDEKAEQKTDEDKCTETETDEASSSGNTDDTDDTHNK